jgi:hypothetical protein
MHVVVKSQVNDKETKVDRIFDLFELKVKIGVE